MPLKRPFSVSFFRVFSVAVIFQDQFSASPFLVVWNILKHVLNAATQSLTDTIQMFQTDSLRKLIIISADRRWPDTSFSRQSCLCPPFFSEQTRQMVFDHPIAPAHCN